MKRVVWSCEARRELEALNDHYGQLSPDLPLTFTLRIDAALSKLLDFPHLGPRVPDSNARKWRAPRMPYVLFYRPTREGIRVLSVRHAHSNWAADD